MGNEKGAWKGIVLGLTSSVVFALVVPWGTWATTQIYDLRQRLAEDKIMAEFVRSQLSELKEEQARTTKEITELEHFLHDGTMFIGETVYNIVGGKVKVAREHLQQALDHIKMGG